MKRAARRSAGFDADVIELLWRTDLADPADPDTWTVDGRPLTRFEQYTVIRADLEQWDRAMTLANLEAEMRHKGPPGGSQVLDQPTGSPLLPSSA